MKFVGIDLAWTYKNETGICILNEDGNIEYLSAGRYSDNEILQILIENSNENLSIGIDAPLIVENENKSRLAERELMKHKINGFHLSVFHVSRNYMQRTYGLIRGEVLLKMTTQHIKELEVSPVPIKNKNSVIETFPTATVCGLFPEIYPLKYKIKPKIPYKITHQNMTTLLHRFRKIEVIDKNINGMVESELLKTELDKKNHKHFEDQTDAFLCAYGLYSIFKEQANAITFGTIDEGFITVPIKNSK